ncbi:MAG: GtrA family protein [Bacteroidales bacterium]|nr:GtrA family protein [Bacteroidales bacterium]
MGYNVLSRERFFELVRFAIVGVIATLVHYGLYLLLKRWINVSVSYTIGYALSFLMNFWLSNVFTFRTKPSMKKGVGFGVSHVINYLLHIALLNLFLWVGLPSNLAPIPVFLIVVPINFLLVRKVLKS